MHGVQVRQLIGPGRLLGVSCKTVEQVVAAAAAGADYAGSGAGEHLWMHGGQWGRSDCGGEGQVSRGL